MGLLVGLDCLEAFLVATFAQECSGGAGVSGGGGAGCGSPGGRLGGADGGGAGPVGPAGDEFG